METNDWVATGIAAAALVVSTWQAIVASRSRRFVKRSTEASEKSAAEATRAGDSAERSAQAAERSAAAAEDSLRIQGEALELAEREFAAAELERTKYVPKGWELRVHHNVRVPLTNNATLHNGTSEDAHDVQLSGAMVSPSQVSFIPAGTSTALTLPVSLTSMVVQWRRPEETGEDHVYQREVITPL